MATVQEGRQAPTFDPSTSAVLAVAEAKLCYVRFTNPDGRVGVTLALVGGKDESDGGPLVLMLPPDALKNLMIPLPYLKAGVRAHMSHGGAAAPSSAIPDLSLPEEQG